MNRSTPGLPVHHQLPEFTQTHVHRVSDAIQPSHPLSPWRVAGTKSWGRTKQDEPGTSWPLQKVRMLTDGTKGKGT